VYCVSIVMLCFYDYVVDDILNANDKLLNILNVVKSTIIPHY
jgi:hypothetical protein